MAAPHHPPGKDRPLTEGAGPAGGLYVHVPFCRALCTYCAFAKELHDPAREALYLEGLDRETAHRTAGGRPRIDTVFLGGGTPSALAPGSWRRLGELLHGRFEILPGAEITAEANPESATPEVLEAMRGTGVNRVSLGVQSAHAAELAGLGRIHDFATVGKAVAAVRGAGISSVNLDLMYGLPGQTRERFAASLEAVLGLGPDHLSAYCLGLEPGTPLAGDVGAGRLPEPDDDVAREQYDVLVSRAEAAGLEVYEISNFARPGHACRHNLHYWRREDFHALGPSAHGLVGGLRWANPAPLDGWLAAYAPGGRPPEPRAVDAGDARFEWVFLRLRLVEGIDPGDYEREWGEPFRARYGPLVDRLETEGLLEREGDRVRLSSGARFVSDAVFTEFALEDAEG